MARRTPTNQPRTKIAALRPRHVVLAIDEDVATLDAICNAIASEHTVHAKTQARDAIEMIRGGLEPKTIFCALAMSDLDGLRFYAFVRQLAPRLADRIVFLVSDPIDDEERAFLESVRNARVDKPPTPERIRSLIG